MLVSDSSGNHCQIADANNNIANANECFVIDQIISPFDQQQQQHINAKLYLMSTGQPTTLRNAQKTKVRLAKQGKNNGSAATIVQHEPNDSNGTCSSSSAGHYNLQTDV